MERMMLFKQEFDIWLKVEEMVDNGENGRV